MTVIGDLPRTMFQMVAEHDDVIGDLPRTSFPVVGVPLGGSGTLLNDPFTVAYHDDSELIFHDGSNVLFRDGYTGESTILGVGYMPRTTYAGETE